MDRRLRHEIGFQGGDVHRVGGDVRRRGGRDGGGRGGARLEGRDVRRVGGNVGGKRERPGRPRQRDFNVRVHRVEGVRPNLGVPSAPVITVVQPQVFAGADIAYYFSCGLKAIEFLTTVDVLVDARRRRRLRR